MVGKLGKLNWVYIENKSAMLDWKAYAWLDGFPENFKLERGGDWNWALERTILKSYKRKF